jgi:hypothetical protein
VAFWLRRQIFIGSWLDRIFGVQTIADMFAKNPSGSALADPGLNTIFVRPSAILGASDRYVGATLFHEVAHLLTGASDGTFMSDLKIGWIQGWISGSDSVTQEIEKKCFPK